jgi:hypothetical protein
MRSAATKRRSPDVLPRGALSPRRSAPGARPGREAAQQRPREPPALERSAGFYPTADPGPVLHSNPGPCSCSTQAAEASRRVRVQNLRSGLLAVSFRGGQWPRGEFLRTSLSICFQHQGASVKIAALFVATDGVYFNLPDVDPWDETRDARRYAGPFPVVAHPPCNLWVNFAALNFKRYGGTHNKPGNDGGCFASALRAVRQYSGVIEHPAGSRAWENFGLLKPEGIGWSKMSPTEWVCEVWQSAYGHPARKRTWLFYSSVDGFKPYEADWGRPSGTHQIGWFDRVKPTLSKKEASKTPVCFAQFLVCLAHRAAVGR